MTKPNKPDKAQMQQMSRFAAFQRESVDAEKRTVEVAFSSEAAVERWFGLEILSHEGAACDLSRLNDAGAVLFNHNWNHQIGVIERAWIDADRKGRALIRFGNGAAAAEKFQDVQDGILRHISVGYSVNDMALDNPEADVGNYRYLVTNWQPYEISFVTVPADTSVGVGRSAPMPPVPTAEMAPTPTETPNTGNRNMEKDQIPQPAAVAADPNNTAERGMQTERERAAELIAIGEAYAQFGGERMAADAIRNGHSKEQLQTALLETMRSKPTQTDCEIGLNDKEQREYSLARAIHAAASGDWSGAGFERECSQALAGKIGKTARGFLVPMDALVRAASNYTVANNASAGTLVDTDFRPQNLIEQLKEKMLLTRLGATYLDGLVGDVSIPKVLTGHASSWINEDGSAEASAATFGQVPLKNKTISGRTQLSRKLLQQASIGIEAFARNSLLEAIGEGIDIAAFTGSGTGAQPLGLFNTTGIGAVTSGGTLDWAHIVALETVLDEANAAGDSLTYVTTKPVRGMLKTTPHKSNVQGYLWNADNTLNGYTAIASGRVPKNLGGSKHGMLFGDFSQLLVGSWGVLDLLVDQYSSSETGAVKIVAFQDVDFAIRHAESFAAIKDIVPA